MLCLQHALGEAFSDLAQKSPELQEEFLYNAETQRNLTKNGETLLGALNFFVSSVNTLCNKTIEDTLLTIRQYETARYAALVSILICQCEKKKTFRLRVFVQYIKGSIDTSLIHTKSNIGHRKCMFMYLLVYLKCCN